MGVAPDPATGVLWQFWGDPTRGGPPTGAPAGAPNDAFVMYDGATKANYPWAQLPTGGWWAWDLRGSILTMTHDLMRFRKLSEVKTFDTTIEHGLYDWLLYVASKLAGTSSSKS